MRTFALALASFSVAVAAFAEDIHKLKKTAVAHKELRVQGYVIVLPTCESKKLPEIDLNIAPAGGTVCVRPGMVHLDNLLPPVKNTQCLGKMIDGVFVIYTPLGSFTGLDTVRYTVRGMQSRTYEAEITLKAGEATAPAASSSPPEPRKAGLMPACPPLVS